MLNGNTGKTGAIVAEVRVTKQFKENFDLWAADLVDAKTWTAEEVDGFKNLMREYELADGPDRLRDTLVHYTPEGNEAPSAIDDPKKRFEYWDNYFASQAGQIKQRHAMAAAANLRLKSPERKAA